MAFPLAPRTRAGWVVLASLPLLAAGATDQTSATAELRTAQAASIGRATLTETPDGLRLVLDVHGMEPGARGAHVHAVGRCELPDFATAGGHLNPDAHVHGLESGAGGHAGDLPNLQVGTDGRGRLEVRISGYRLRAGPRNILDADGAAIVIHAFPDDQRSDPAGNSGPRIACGVLVAAGR